MAKVAIDAGHGSETNGKRTPEGYREHWINVKTAYYCEQYLLKHNVEVFRVAWDDLNSMDDMDVSLTTRQKQIKNAKCDYSVSMHANAFGDGKTFNSADGVSTHIHNNPSRINDSLKFAQCIQNRVAQGTTQRNRGVVKQQLAMCNCSAMGTKASCLVEIAFMTNKREADLMKTDDFCKEQGEDIAKGILDYLNISLSVNVNSTTTATPSLTPSVEEMEICKVGQFHSINFTGNIIPTNGLWDNNTKKQAVRVLQQAMNLDYKSNLKVDGVFGTKSLKALGNHYVKKGETQHMCTALVILLLLHGYLVSLDSAPETFDSNIEVAVKQYQKSIGLSATGIADAKTFKNLIN